MVNRVLVQAGPSCLRSKGPGIHNTPVSSTISRRACFSDLGRKSFSTSSRYSQEPDSSIGKERLKGETHYETLGVPHGASRMEIKAAYFRLSKRYHPDVRRSARQRSSEDSSNTHREDGKIDGSDRERQSQKDVEAEKRATERFHEVSTAYKVLSDDRQRRAYDRSLTSSTHTDRTTHTRTHTPGSSHTHASAYELHSRRRRGATHAWENTGPRAYTGRTHTHTHTHTHPHTHTSAGAGRHYDPSTSPFASYQYHAGSNSSTNTSFSSGTGSGAETEFGVGTGVGTGTGGRKSSVSERLKGRALRDEEERVAHDRIVRESNVSRFFRALGIILVVSWVGSLGMNR